MTQIMVPQAVPLKGIPDVELVAVGTWAASTGKAVITDDDLRSGVGALDCPGIHKPVLKLGHHEPNPDGTTRMRWDGTPAVGWISNMRLSTNGAKILGDYTGVPGWLVDVMPSAYPQRSVEIQRQFKCQIGHTHPFVITAVSLLGEMPPAVGVIRSLNDVQALYTLAATVDGPPPAEVVRSISVGLAAPTDGRRAPTDVEVASAADFARDHEEWERAIAALLTAYGVVQRRQREQLTAQIGPLVDAGRYGDLAALTVDSGGAADLIYEQMFDAAAEAITLQAAEAAAQGVVGLTAVPDEIYLRRAAEGIAATMASTLSATAGRDAAQLAAPGVAGETVAVSVGNKLSDLSDRFLRDQFSGAVGAARASGRYTVLSVAPRGDYYAAELNDANTCRHCRDIDGTRFPDLDTAMTAYGAGGYQQCEGRGRCRGRLIAVWEAATMPETHQFTTVALRVGDRVTFAKVPNKPGKGDGKQLKDYWVHGEGAAKWTTWTELYHHLLKHIPNVDEAKRTAANWFHERYGFWPGDKKNDTGGTKAAADLSSFALQVGDRVLFGTIMLHLPGQHNQKSHGNTASRPHLQNVPGKTGLARLAALALAHKAAEDEKAGKEAQAATEAKIAAKQAALVKKWKGKPAPKIPQKPQPPQDDAARHFDGWLAKLNERYNALGTGKTLDKSFNYSYVQTAINQAGTPEGNAAVAHLLSEKYIDGKLVHDYDDAVKKMQVAAKEKLNSADYVKSLKTYKTQVTRHKREKAQWQEVNGVSGNLNGMDGALVHKSDKAGVSWALNAFPTPEDPDVVNALQTYTGSSYTQWNTALRAAKGGKIGGGWSSYTKFADEGMTPFPEDVMLVRGTRLDEFAFPDGTRTSDAPPPDPMSLIGSVQTQHGYMSTSVGLTPGYGGNQVLMKVRVPAGHKGSYVSGFSGNKGERELLLQRDTHIFVHDVYKSGGKWIFEVEVLPPDTSPDEMAGHLPMPLTKN